MFSKKNINRICSVLWVIGFTLSFVQPAYAAPVEASQAVAAAEMLQFTSSGHALGFSSAGMLAATGSHALRVEFVNANTVQPQSDTPASQKGQAAALGQVTYTNLWNGITLVYAATGGSIYTTTYQVAPGANPANIRLNYNTPLTLNRDGRLGINFQTGTLSESAPSAWQEINGQRVAVKVSFKLEGQQVSFTLGTYNPVYTLTIDPSLTWNTFLGGSGDEMGADIAVDGSGNIYVTGQSMDAWGAPVRSFSSGSHADAFVAKLNPSGMLVWNTFLGSSSYDDGYGIAVDGSGNVFVTGTSWVTWGTPVQPPSGSNECFVAKLNSDGVLVWNTFLGGSKVDWGYGIAVDGSGSVIVSGISGATWGTPVSAYNAGDDTFVAKLSSDGALTWNAFFGGSGDDDGTGMAMDNSGNVIVTGASTATWGIPVRAYSGGKDAFVAKISPSGTLIWNTFLGGSGDEDRYIVGIAVDGSGNVVVTGDSNTTWGTPIQAFSGDHDAFAAKLSPSGALTWNTFLGGSGDDGGTDISADGSGNVYVTGFSHSTWGNPLLAYSGYEDAFIAKLNPSGTITANTFLGGSGYNNVSGEGITVDSSGNSYVTGDNYGYWGNPLWGPNGGWDAFIAKVDLSFPAVVSSVRANANPSSAASVNFTVTFSEAVTGVDKTDFNLTTTGITGASVSSVSGSGKTYTVAVNTGSGDGTLRLNVIDNDSIIDAASNPLGGQGPMNGNFYTGGIYTINKTPPGATTLVSPLTTTTLAKPTYVWSKVTAATYYRLWVKNSDGAWVMQNLYYGANICGATNCAVMPNIPLTDGIYTWYIQTLTATLNGTWSAHSFTVAIPVPGVSTLVSPKGITHLSKPTFIWSKDSVATLYRLWVKNSSGTWVFQNLYAGKNICGQTNCAMVSPVTLANGSYTWYIQTLTNTQNGQWSAQAIVVSVPDEKSSQNDGEVGAKK